MKSIIVFCTLLTLASAAVAAETPLNLSQKISVIHGTADGGAKADALVFYVPAGTLDPKESLAKCKFKEDEFSPNGAGKIIKLPVVQTQNGYSVSIPMTGLRGQCSYVLDTVYLNFDSGKVYENISILTKAKVDLMNKDLVSAGLEPMEVTLLKDLQKLFCEFSTQESVGLCHTPEGFLPEPNYEMADTPADYLLDVRDTTAE